LSDRYFWREQHAYPMPSAIGREKFDIDQPGAQAKRRFTPVTLTVEHASHLIAGTSITGKVMPFCSLLTLLGIDSAIKIKPMTS